MGEVVRAFLFAVMLMALLVGNPALAMSVESSVGSTVESALFEEAILPGTTPMPVTPATGTPSTTSKPPASCDVTELSLEEAKAIMNLTSQGFQGEEIGDGIDEKADGIELDKIDLVGESPDGKSAIKQEAPNKAASADRFSLFTNREFIGPFGIGLILYDTLRVGRCEDKTQESCRINGSGLSYRSSGKGFVSDLTNAFTSLKDASGRLANNVSEEEYQAMQNNIFDDDKNHFTVAGIEPTDQITNSFLTSSYTAKQATNCINSECIIATYSAFDKYYNSWFSTEMVVSSFGPTLLHQSKKLLGFGKRGSKDSWIKQVNNWVETKRQGINDIPVALSSRNRISRFQDTVKENGLGKVWENSTIKKKLFSSGGAGEIDELLKADSVIMKLAPEQKKKFFQSLDDLRSYTRTSNVRVQELAKRYNTAVAAAGNNIVAKQAAQVDFARQMSGIYINWDDVVYLDFPEWIRDSGNLAGFKKLTVKRNNTLSGQGFLNLADEGSFNAKEVMKEFQKNGDWSTWAGSIDARTMKVVESGPDAGKIILYEVGKDGQLVKAAASADDMVQVLGTSGAGAQSIRNNLTGEIRALNQQNIDLVQNGAWSGNFDIVSSSWVPKTTVDPITGATTQVALGPNEFAPLITQKRIYGRVNTANLNLDDLYYTLRENPEFIQKRNWSLLDSQFAKEKDLMVNFYKQPLKTGIPKGTLLPIAYWNLKKGLGSEMFSAYMLPDTWTQINITQGSEEIYDDSYADFYANEGSDQGDMFARVINYPLSVYNYVATKFTEENNTIAGDWISRVTGSPEGIQPEGFLAKSITRDEVMDLAFYSHNENCSGCSGNLASKDDSIRLTLDAPVEIEAFIAEAADVGTAEKKGSTIIAYTHHSNLEGKSGQIEGGNINLSVDRENGNTCDQKLRGLGLGWAGSASGLALAGAESMFYVVGIGPGIIASVIQQTLITPKIQDCVDDQEGYYIHFYDPPPATAQAKKTKEVLSSETLTDAVGDMASNLKSTISNTDNPVAQSMGEITDQFTNFATQAKQQNILQAKIDLLPPNSGTVIGKQLFYWWFKGNSMPTGLKTEGKMVTKDGNISVEVDYEDGDLLIDGKKVIDGKKEIVGLITPGDDRGPFQAVPRRVNTVTAPNSDETVFELNGAGQIFVKHQDVLACIIAAIKNQSGITYSGNELTQVFGKLRSINTQGYEKVFVRDSTIYLEGSGPRVQGGLASNFIIDGFWNSRLEMSSDKTIESGKFIGMAFDHGSIVLNKETNELVIWLRQHKDAVLTDNEVSGLNAKLSTSTDPDTGCEQPAIELDAEAYPNDELGQKKVENFNTSMGILGPFTQFTTDGKIYEFYSKRDTETGECKDFFKVIDKETGEVLTDSEIVGGITQGDDGKLSFQTADGRNHTLEFDADNGVPTLKYNNGPAETLRTAQGPNGSFWYDPTTGKWYPENSMQIPLGQAFKDNGTLYNANADGSMSGKPVNPMTFNIGQQEGQGFNIPSLPETVSGLALFIALFLSLAFITTRRNPIKIKRS
jgi:hypothetical protein